MKPFASHQSRIQLGLAGMVLAWFSAVLVATGGFLVGDEWVHWNQIARFVSGDYHVYTQWLTNVPGYHWLATFVLWLLGQDSLAAGRLITAAMYAACVILFHRIRLRLHPEDALRATAQFLFLPILFVYGFLVYTDVPALMFLLAAFLATLRGQHVVSSVMLLASMGMRQNNVLWVVFVAVWTSAPLLKTIWHDPDFRSLRWAAWRKSILDVLALVWPYLFAFACFLVYWYINGSISYSNAQSTRAHPDFRPDTGNLFWLGAIFMLLMPVHAVTGLLRQVRSRKYMGWVLVTGLLLFVFGVFALSFKVQHPYNVHDWGFIRNRILIDVNQGGTSWWLFGSIASLGICGLVLQPWVERFGWLWIPFAFLFVSASWLIETRYVIMPLVMCLIFRKSMAAWIESLMLAAWVLLSLWLAWSIFDQRFML